MTTTTTTTTTTATWYDANIVPQTEYVNYLYYLSLPPVPAYKCRYCPDFIRIYCTAYEEHSTTDHGLDSRVSCVWCNGHYTWPKGEKRRHVKHLLSCWVKYDRSIESRRTGGALYVPNSREHDTEKLYLEYLEHMHKTLLEFQCPECGDPLETIQYEEHCAKKHGLNPSVLCVWCQGRYSWEEGEKSEQADHLSQCYTNFIQSFQKPEWTDDTLEALDDTLKTLLLNSDLFYIE